MYGHVNRWLQEVNLNWWVQRRVKKCVVRGNLSIENGRYIHKYSGRIIKSFLVQEVKDYR